MGVYGSEGEETNYTQQICLLHKISAVGDSLPHKFLGKPSNAERSPFALSIPANKKLGIPGSLQSTFPLLLESCNCIERVLRIEGGTWTEKS